ncbi:MAG: hypothetical protein E7605_07485 [Ruminococcaceae bacterium]|nr:hypothetical protein [Oscillospiraceae bacterium]
MRYFKYKNINQTIEKRALREQYATLTRQEKRQYHKEKLLSGLGLVLFFTVSALSAILLFDLIERIPESTVIWINILDWIAKGILYLVAGIVSLIIGAVVSTPLFTKATGVQKQIKRDVLSRACEHLRSYYGIQEPCLVTKCYDSSEASFTNHDVCLFFCDGELRITANLVSGFFHGKADLGCYAFDTKEISYVYATYHEVTATELRAGELHFFLGKRAVPFIKKYLNEMENPHDRS